MNTDERIILFLGPAILGLIGGAIWGEIYGLGWKRGAKVGVITAYTILVLYWMTGGLNI